MASTADKFAVALAQLISPAVEGGVSRDTRDSASSVVAPGQAHTNLGITLKVVRQLDADGHLSAYLRDALDVDNDGDIDSDDVVLWTPQTAAAFYDENYWKATDCDRIPWPISNLVFDLAVNAGKVRAIRTLQAAIGVAADGILGPDTFRALERRCATPDGKDAVLQAFTVHRLEFYRGCRDANTFFRGWAARSIHTLLFSMSEVS